MLWKRVYRVEFPDIGYVIDKLRVSFQVEKDLSQESNKASVRIYNLAPENRAKLEQPDLKMNLYAGYEANMGAVQLFSGTTTQAFSSDDGENIMTELRVSDGQMNLRDSVVSVSFAPGTSGETVLQDVARRMGLAVQLGEGGHFCRISEWLFVCWVWEKCTHGDLRGIRPDVERAERDSSSNSCRRDDRGSGSCVWAGVRSGGISAANHPS